MSESITVPVDVHVAASRALVLLVNENAELRSEAAYQRERADSLARDLAVAVGHPCVADEPIEYELVEELEPDVPVVRVPRVFHHGDVIPEDVDRLLIGQDLVARCDGGGWWYVDDLKPSRYELDRDGWPLHKNDFPVTEVIREDAEPVTYTLRETAELLNQHNIDTGQNRLKDFLNTGICWTDGFGSPRPVADKYLVETDKANKHRPAVVRVTPEGVSELARVMGMAV